MIAAHELLGWLGSYLVHSSVLIGAAFVVQRCGLLRSHPLREGLWTLALFGGIATATLQSFGGFDPLLGTLRFATSAPAAAAPALLEVAAAKPALPDRDPPAYPSIAAPPERAHERAAEARTVPALLPLALDVLVRAAIGFALAFVLFLLIATARGLRRRRPIEAGDLRERLDALCAAAGAPYRVRLSASERLATPVAFGIVRPEICVPERALGELPSAQQDAMLLHELAHLLRGDPLRLLAARAVEVLLFIQPLNRMARRALFEVIEARCDAFAVRGAGHGLALAECLATVATWMTESRTERAVLAMAERGSSLGRRIHALLDGEGVLRRERPRRAAGPLLALALPLVALGAPAIALDRAEVERAPEPAVAIEPSAEVERAALLSDAAAALAAEIDQLAGEVAEIRTELEFLAGDDELAAALERIEHRIDRLNERRALLEAWRNKVPREAGLDARQEQPSPHQAGPRSRER